MMCNSRRLNVVASSATALAALVFCRPALAARERRAATADIQEIRQAVATLHDRILSLRAVVRIRGAHGGDRHLREILCAKGPARYMQLRRFVADQWAEQPGDGDSFYDGIDLCVFYPAQRTYEMSRRMAVPPYLDKVRGSCFFEALSWWPPGDASTPPSYEGRTYFVRYILADPECRVADAQQLVDGHWCHVVDVPRAHRLWIDVARGVLIRRDCFVGPEARLLSRCELRDYRHVAEGIELPFLLTRVVPAAGNQGTITVDEYQVNNVTEATFQFRPPPGTLVIDRDTDKALQIPGGLEYLDDICARAKSLSVRDASSDRARGGAATELVCAAGGALVGAVIVFMAVATQRRPNRRSLI